MKMISALLIAAALAAGYATAPPAGAAGIRLAGGVRLHYETAGSGTIPVVLVHGYGMSSVVWEKALPLLPSGYRWLAVDLRGFGRSDKPADGYSCPELAQDLGAFMDALGLPQAVLVGHSFGGLVVQHFAARYPERVLGLVLSNAFAASLPPKGISPAVAERIAGYGSPDQNRKVFSAMVPRYFDAAHVTAAELSRFVDVALEADNGALKGTLTANYTTEAIPVERLAAVKAPTLILVSTHDPFGTFDQAVAMSDALPSSRIRVIERCGHTPMWERPAEFARIVGDFLSRVCPAPGRAGQRATRADDSPGR